MSRIAGLFDVDLTFTEECAQRLARATGDAKRGRLGILINGKVLIAPVFISPISSKAVLSGIANRETAEKMAGALKRR
jgi:preprotein translocase subunit SecD